MEDSLYTGRQTRGYEGLNANLLQEPQMIL